MSSPVPPAHRGSRDPGDAWVELEDGRKFWGRFGAAGLLVSDPARGILLQHRVAWSHFGGTWGIPGGARHLGEDALTGALRESAEEAAVRPDLLRPVATHLYDIDVWSYTTLVAETVEPFEVHPTDAESVELRWVPAAEVDDYPLHPAFGVAWPLLRTVLDAPPVLVVDGANVVGSRPDGWWRDRPGAATRLFERLSTLAAAGLPAAELGVPGFETVWPRIVLVVEGQAKALSIAPPGAAATPAVELVHAEQDGDSAIIDVVARLGGSPLVVTADRGLGARITELGGRLARPSWLLEHLDALD